MEEEKIFHPFTVIPNNYETGTNFPHKKRKDNFTRVMSFQKCVCKEIIDRMAKEKIFHPFTVIRNNYQPGTNFAQTKRGNNFTRVMSFQRCVYKAIIERVTSGPMFHPFSVIQNNQQTEKNCAHGKGKNNFTSVMSFQKCLFERIIEQMASHPMFHAFSVIQNNYRMGQDLAHRKRKNHFTREIMSPKREIRTISSKKPRKPRNSQTRSRLPKLTKNELCSMMCIKVTEGGLRLKEPEITFPFPMWLNRKKQDTVSEQPKEDPIPPSKVSENNCQEKIETKKSNESFNSSDAKNLTGIGYYL
ncbi:hypothetical protein C922_05600 [Plasmodium inui San Antonio 1]|uniref:Uncharacterized protein n=1 Tax=Plasmodium inui San Antonio 1 TaxID=1237626 RepID=W6ZT09_9APIC|nr:hypothetical protein C922_05600 [Plasmodium inui San Antonio 1]EUD64017.1 hypothetical protein C922_05600 [Plasmodium inui San Antonio 1]